MSRKIVAVFALLTCFCIFSSATAFSVGTLCPWTISKIKVGKWGNGNHKARIWVSGSFPIPPGDSERPTWYVNGTNVGKSLNYFNGERTLPNASIYLTEGANTITVKFVQPPYNGVSNQKTISGFSWDKVPIGAYKSFQ